MKLFKIEENDADQRLDKFLRKLFPNATRSLIYKLNRKDKIKVKFEGSDGKFRKKDNEYKLQNGDEMKIFMKEEDFEKLSKKVGEKTIVGIKKIEKQDIIYEDGDLLILNKNPGINVHPGDHKTKELSLIALVHDYFQGSLNSLTFKPSLIHRIDRDTSGIIMIAKKKDILTRLVNDLKNHKVYPRGMPNSVGRESALVYKKVKKTYTAFVFGKVSRKSGTITKKLLRIENAKNQNKVQVSDRGQIAITHYEVRGEYKLETKNGIEIITQLECNIETGRMHQIRVHLESVGNPIVGDNTYGNKSLNAYIAKNFGLKRQALHASKISFFHYGRKKRVELSARLKKDMEQFLNILKKQV